MLKYKFNYNLILKKNSEFPKMLHNQLFVLYVNRQSISVAFS